MTETGPQAQSSPSSCYVRVLGTTDTQEGVGGSEELWVSSKAEKIRIADGKLPWLFLDPLFFWVTKSLSMLFKPVSQAAKLRTDLGFYLTRISLPSTQLESCAFHISS